MPSCRFVHVLWTFTACMGVMSSACTDPRGLGHRADKPAESARDALLQSLSLERDAGLCLERVVTGFSCADGKLCWTCEAGLMDAVATEWTKEIGYDRPPVSSSIGLPIDVYHRLCLIRKDGVRPIVTPGDLKGFVKIDTSENALEFVRLFSSPATYFKFPETRYMEVDISGSAITGRIGGLFPEGVRKVPVKVRREGDRFCVRRPVAVLRKGEGNMDVARAVGIVVGVAVLDERVGQDGDYSLRVLWNGPPPQDENAIPLPSLR